MVGLGSVWGKFQSLGIFQGLLKVVLVFWGLVLGLFRVGLGRISIMHRGVYLGLRSKKTENSGEAEQWRSREAKKQKSKEAEKQRSREKKKSKKQRSRKAKTQGNINPKKKDKTGKK
jgi:hypothetical protein